MVYQGCRPGAGVIGQGHTIGRGQGHELWRVRNISWGGWKGSGGGEVQKWPSQGHGPGTDHKGGGGCIM